MDGLGEAPVYHSTPLHSDESDPYAKDAKHSKYWRSTQTLKPIRFPK